jgi:hypothetical protein
MRYFLIFLDIFEPLLKIDQRYRYVFIQGKDDARTKHKHKH